ncbi:HNH endonuclease [Clostridium perfringens]|jgi:hypothetical protein|uniref:HNH endonuclease n=1 Tax=Clostridium perfringens TaxID=1502 RepID=A0AAW4IZJ2_CLOPF|nr:HNH endonuclease [Clostridium perfringens]MBO3356150.1 HNH endonuclease [Clostridium perfringens]MBO3359509.1 HNH endonuclease [Clostridium perfringens]
MKVEILKVSGINEALWFNSEQGIRRKDNVYELNLTQGKGITKYIGRFKNKQEAIEERKNYLLNLFINNAKRNNINIENIKETEIKNIFASKEGFILNRFGHVLKGSTNRDGYKNVTLSFDGKQKSFLVHRIILKTFQPNNNYSKLDVNHIDGNKKNNSLENLEWCTRSENVIHAFKTGLQNNVAGKLVVNKDMEKKFIKMRKEGFTYKKIADETGYCEKTIRNHCKKYQ